MGKMDRDQAEKMVGKKTPLPGAGQPAGPNWAPKPAAAASSGKSGIGALPANPVTNPRAILDDREKKAGMAKGGLVRGAGAAVKGKRFTCGG